VDFHAEEKVANYQIEKILLKKLLPENWFFTFASGFYRVSNTAFVGRVISVKCTGFPFKILIKDWVTKKWYGSE
jgi:hypothetical protein